MPIRAAHACAHRGCPNLVRGQGRYCDEHEKQVREEYDSQRGSSAERGYGHRWQRLRRMFLRANPLCVDPYGEHKAAGHIEMATVVDHITPKNAGGDDSWDNLQALCVSCHGRKTVLEDGGYGRG